MWDAKAAVLLVLLISAATLAAWLIERAVRLYHFIEGIIKA